MKRSQLFLGTVASACMGILILDSKTAFQGAEYGLTLAIQSLIPSLFPFFVTSSIMTQSFMGHSLPPLEPLRKLFQLPDGCSCILIPAFLGGYPAGAQCIGQTFSHNSLSRDNAQRLLLFCNNAGPAFLFGVLRNTFPALWMIWALWAINIFSALICSWIFSDNSQTTASITAVPTTFQRILSLSMRTMGFVCCWVILFRIFVNFLDRWFLWFFPKSVRILLIGILELSNGCLELGSIDNVQLRFVICSALLSFGGLCVTMQTYSVIGKLSIRLYLVAKLIQTLFSLLLSWTILSRNVWPLFIIVTLGIILKKTVAFREYMLYNRGSILRRNRYAV